MNLSIGMILKVRADKITTRLQKWNIKETAVVILNAQIQFLPQTIHDEYTHKGP